MRDSRRIKYSSESIIAQIDRRERDLTCLAQENDPKIEARNRKAQDWCRESTGRGKEV